MLEQEREKRKKEKRRKKDNHKKTGDMCRAFFKRPHFWYSHHQLEAEFSREAASV
jgi:hypothetical protein